MCRLPALEVHYSIREKHCFLPADLMVRLTSRLETIPIVVTGAAEASG
jgi:hypothetical protein